MAIWNILWIFGIFYDHSVHFVFIWYLFPVLVSCTKKNLATLAYTCNLRKCGWMILNQGDKKEKKCVPGFTVQLCTIRTISYMTQFEGRIKQKM
jgi:hypothetical protein